MKTVRTFLIRFLLIVAMASFVGCATTEHGETAEKTAQDQQWEDMSPAQKLGTCLWMPLQYGMLFGGYYLAGH
jgi:hypothetical protein